MAISSGLSSHPRASQLLALRDLIGNTPLLAIHVRYRARQVTVFAKAEFLSLTGSIKDRMALSILERAIREGRLRPGDMIAEATSGNTGISIAAIGKALGHSVQIFMPDWMSVERRRLMESLGAEVTLVSREEGGFSASIRACERLACECRDVFLPSQFSNKANVDAHEQTTGPEIATQLDVRGIRPTAFVAGVGTGGTVMGVGRYLRQHCPGIAIHPVEPSESPTLSTGHRVGSHRIQGISDEFIPPIVKLDELDSVLSVPDGDAILMAQQLARRLGLGVGISSGANMLAALKALDRLPPNGVVVTVFCDDNKKYLTTDLMRDEPVRADYMTPHVVLEDFVSIPRRICSANAA